LVVTGTVAAVHSVADQLSLQLRVVLDVVREAVNAMNAEGTVLGELSLEPGIIA
jgi:hypothetical protein